MILHLNFGANTKFYAVFKLYLQFCVNHLHNFEIFARNPLLQKSKILVGSEIQPIKRASCDCYCSRISSSVVWQPRDYGMVDPFMAQRRFRNFHGVPLYRRYLPRMANFRRIYRISFLQRSDSRRHGFFSPYRGPCWTP